MLPIVGLTRYRNPFQRLGTRVLFRSAEGQACGQVPATADSDLAKDLFEVVLHGVWGQVQSVCDRLGARALHDQQSDVFFAGGQAMGG